MRQVQRLTIAPSQRTGEQITLTAEQQHYLSRVLRLQSGDQFIAMDGQGQWWLAALQADLSTANLVEAVTADTELPIAVTLLIALPKNGMDDIVRQATELGVSHIVPILSDRSLLQPSPQKQERWQRIAQEAAEQSERQVVPTLSPPMPWADALQVYQSNTLRYVCEARGDCPHLLRHLETQLHDPSQASSSLQPDVSIVIATGPEGGWTDSEIAQAIAADYTLVSLGSRILRAITAPLVALSLVSSVIEMMPPPPQSD